MNTTLDETTLGRPLSGIVYNARFAIHGEYPSLLGFHDPLDIDPPWEAPTEPALLALLKANEALIAEANKPYEKVRSALEDLFDPWDERGRDELAELDEALYELAELMAMAGATSALHSIGAPGLAAAFADQRRAGV